MSVTETAAERYRRNTSAKAAIVDVTAPSGEVFKFEKPSRFGMLFGMGQLPTSAASAAVAEWQKDGIVEANSETEPGGGISAMMKTVADLRDRVLELSRSPKIVIGTADESKDELSTDHILDGDLEYLFKWVASGGNASGQLATFPQGPQSGTVAQPNRKARRASAK